MLGWTFTTLYKFTSQKILYAIHDRKYNEMKLFVLGNILVPIYLSWEIYFLHLTEKYLTIIPTYELNRIKMHIIFLALGTSQPIFPSDFQNLFYNSHCPIHSCNFHNSPIPSYNCLPNNIKYYPVWFVLFCRPLNSPKMLKETPCHIFCPSHLMHMRSMELRTTREATNYVATW
jgi:hypothetical protein